jgi:hypothetical protein
MSESVQIRTHVHIYVYTFLLRMTDTMTFQNTDLSSWDILYMEPALALMNSAFCPHDKFTWFL